MYLTTKEPSYPTDAIAEVQSEILGDRFMTMRGRNLIIAASVLLSLVFLQISPSMVSGQNPEEPIKSGPYVDKIMFKVITQDDQQVLALYDDEIDLIGDPYDEVRRAAKEFLKPPISHTHTITIAEIFHIQLKRAIFF